MSNWKRTTLGEVVSESNGLIQTGPFGSQLHASDYVENGIPCIMPTNMKENRVSLTGIARISDKDAQRLSQHLVKSGDIVYSRRGDITQKALISGAENGFFCGTGCILIRPGGNVDSRFLTYFLSTKESKEWLINHAVGITMPNLNTKILFKLPLRLPSKDHQEKIADVLSSIDKKIEINNRINAELEAMAKTLYDYWFVQFDFPDENGKPYKSSGGKMVYSKELKREIPAGWNVVPIEYYADIIDPHPSHRAPKETQVGFPFAGIGDIDSEGNISVDKVRVIDEEFVLKQECDYEINKYSLGYGRVGTVGKVVKLRKQKFRYAISPTLAVINPKESRHAGYVYRCVKDKIFFQNVIKNTSGTTRPAIGIQQLRKIPILKPSNNHDDMFVEFENFTKVLFEKSTQTNAETQSFIELRDWLLPMLMNGQVRVESAADEVKLKEAGL